ncbi:326_t:CDS:2 [Funneliformis mosseae]|uniref:326_t:CDS:1 n=1 Tax=Funneliformis mosseae TaxID=27381 RepID=A0A9N9F5J8_FUNMO|nr:326_t:CDS:2 [Funneliformis mosseae]
MAKKTVEVYLEITKKTTRKRKEICYNESLEKDHSSDPEYAENSKEKQKLRTKCSYKKVNCDGIDKGFIILSVETSEIPNLKDTTLYKITLTIIDIIRNFRKY